MKNLLLPGCYFLLKMNQQVAIAEFVVFAVELLVVEPVELSVNKRLRLAREARESVNVFNFMMNFLSSTNLEQFSSNWQFP